MEFGPMGCEQLKSHRLFVEHTGLLTECSVLEGRCDDLLRTAIPSILQIFPVGSEILRVKSNKISSGTLVITRVNRLFGAL